MALVLANRVRETSTTAGTGTITLAGAVTGYQTFSAGIGANNTCYYTISNPGVAEWEVGLGTVGSPATTLARTTILASSNAGSAVNFSAGTKDVFVTYPSSKSVYLDASGNASALGTPASGTVTNLTGTASININGTVGATTPNTGAFTTGSFSGAISVTAAATSTFRNDQNTDTQVYIRNDSAGAAATARFDLFTGTGTDRALTLASFGPGYTGSYAGVNYANLRYISDNAAAANSNGLMLTSSFKNVYIAPAATLVGTFSSTGLAITGTISATDTISSTKNGALFTKTGGTTNAQWFQIANNNNSYVGVESSAGGAIFTGSTAYAAVWGSASNYPAEIYSNNSKVAAFSSTGLSVTGALSSTGLLSSAGAIRTTGAFATNTASAIGTEYDSGYGVTRVWGPDASTIGVWRLRQSASDGSGNRYPITIGPGVQVGAPTGGDLGAGTINVAADIYKNNTAYTNPDYVLEHWATGQIVKFADKDGAKDYTGLMPLREVESFARTNLHLPRFGQSAEHGLFSGSDALLASVEEAYIHMFSQEARIARLEAALANAGISVQ